MRDNTLVKYICEDIWHGNIYICDSCKSETIWGSFTYCPSCGRMISWADNYKLESTNGQVKDKEDK